MGFHWTPCKNPGSAIVPLSILIACLMFGAELPSIIRAVIPAVEWGSGFLAAGMVLSSIVYAVLMRVLMPRTIYVRGDNFVTLTRIETPDVSDMGNDQIPVHNVIPISSRAAYVWKEDRQQQLHQGRDQGKAR